MVYKVTKTMAKLLTNAMPLSVPFPDIQNTDDCIFQGRYKIILVHDCFLYYMLCRF